MSKYAIVPTSSIDIRIADKKHCKETFEREKQLRNEDLKEKSKKELFDYYKDVIDKIDIEDVISTMIAYDYATYTINSEFLSSHVFGTDYPNLYKTWDREFFTTTPLCELDSLNEDETRSFYQILSDRIPIEYRDRYAVQFHYDKDDRIDLTSNPGFKITMHTKQISGYINAYCSNIFYCSCFCCVCCLPSYYEFVK